MKHPSWLIAAGLSIGCLFGVCGCGTFPMRGDTNCAILQTYSGSPLSANQMATLAILKQDDVWVDQLDGQTVRFGPFPPMGAWKEIHFELTPGAHALIVNRPAAAGSASYSPNSGRYVASNGRNPYRHSFTFTAEAGHTYAIKNAGTPWVGTAWSPYVVSTTAGRTNRIDVTSGE